MSDFSMLGSRPSSGGILRGWQDNKRQKTPEDVYLEALKAAKESELSKAKGELGQLKAEQLRKQAEEGLRLRLGEQPQVDYPTYAPPARPAYVPPQYPTEVRPRVDQTGMLLSSLAALAAPEAGFAAMATPYQAALNRAAEQQAMNLERYKAAYQTSRQAYQDQIAARDEQIRFGLLENERQRNLLTAKEKQERNKSAFEDYKAQMAQATAALEPVGQVQDLYGPYKDYMNLLGRQGVADTRAEATLQAIPLRGIEQRMTEGTRGEEQRKTAGVRGDEARKTLGVKAANDLALESQRHQWRLALKMQMSPEQVARINKMEQDVRLAQQRLGLSKRELDLKEAGKIGQSGFKNPLHKAAEVTVAKAIDGYWKAVDRRAKYMAKTSAEVADPHTYEALVQGELAAAKAVADAKKALAKLVLPFDPTGGRIIPKQPSAMTDAELKRAIAEQMSGSR